MVPWLAKLVPVRVARSATHVPPLVAFAALSIRSVACSQPVPVNCGVPSVRRAPESSLPSLRACEEAVTRVSPPPWIRP